MPHSVGIASLLGRDCGRLRAQLALRIMGDELQDKPRKELKELCSRNNIRTAGVKHEDLVRLLRNKLYPAAPFTPRSKSARGAKEPSPGKDTSAYSYKTPVTSGGSKARSSRASTPREEFQRKNSGLSRKPLLTKSNTFSSRTRVVDGRPQVGVGDQENVYRRPAASKVKGLSPLSRRCAEAPGQLEKMSESRHEEDDSGSDASRRVSEVATDAGPDTMSDFSDADEFRSVSSEPVSRLSKRSSGLRTESSKMSLLSAQSGLSFFTADSWSSENSQSLENLLDSRRGDDDVFPEFPDGSNFLVDALEVSFLDAGAADPEAVAAASTDPGFTAMHSPMARDYVNYNRGSETDPLENRHLSIASSEEDRHSRHNMLDVSPSDLAPDASVDTADVDTPTRDGDASTDVTTPEDEAEAHSGVPEGEESESPAFDYSVAKKLEFEPVEITSSDVKEGEGGDESKSQKMEPAAVETETVVNPPDSSATNTQEPAEEEAGCAVDEREGLHVKSGDEQCEAAHDYNKPVEDGREKEDVQASLPFPLSVILWCTQSCSSTSASRTQTSTS